jgi:hypothetical protein
VERRTTFSKVRTRGRKFAYWRGEHFLWLTVFLVPTSELFPKTLECAAVTRLFISSWKSLT